MNGILLIILLIFSNLAFADSIIGEDTIREWGYKSLKNIQYMAAFCEKPAPASTKNVQYQSIKSLSTLNQRPKTYLRFTLAIEKYDSVELAKARLLRLETPVNKSSKHSKMCNLKKSFSIHKNVYFVHTDAGLFVPELSRIIELYLAYTNKLSVSN